MTMRYYVREAVVGDQPIEITSAMAKGIVPKNGVLDMTGLSFRLPDTAVGSDEVVVNLKLQRG